VFVVAQLVFTMVLLVGSGLLLKSFANLRSVDPGFEPGGLVTFQVELPMVTKYPSQEGREQFFAELRQRLGSLPGVQSVANASSVPMGEGGFSSSFWIDGRPEPDPADRPVADLRLVSLKYFTTMKIPLLRGRTHDDREIEDGPHEVLVNRTLSDRFFPGDDPIGALLRLDGMPSSTIIGVVGDVRHAGLAEEPRPTIYYAADQVGYNFMTVVVRTDGRPEGAVQAIRHEVASMDGELPLHNVGTAEDLLDQNVRSDRFTSLLLGLFATLALVLAGVGTYGVMASAVGRRRRELGIRAALGARPTDAFWAVVRDGGRLVLTGVALGGVLAAALSDALEGALYAIDPLDPGTYALTAAFLVLVGLATVGGTALRAANADPAETLRTE
jgi:putative ABC transport system permease protein